MDRSQILHYAIYECLYSHTLILDALYEEGPFDAVNLNDQSREWSIKVDELAGHLIEGSSDLKRAMIASGEFNRKFERFISDETGIITTKTYDKIVVVGKNAPAPREEYAYYFFLQVIPNILDVALDLLMSARCKLISDIDEDIQQVAKALISDWNSARQRLMELSPEATAFLDQTAIDLVKNWERSILLIPDKFVD